METTHTFFIWKALSYKYTLIINWSKPAMSRGFTCALRQQFLKLHISLAIIFIVFAWPAWSQQRGSGDCPSYQTDRAFDAATAEKVMKLIVHNYLNVNFTLFQLRVFIVINLWIEWFGVRWKVRMEVMVYSQAQGSDRQNYIPVSWKQSKTSSCVLGSLWENWCQKSCPFNLFPPSTSHTAPQIGGSTLHLTHR